MQESRYECSIIAHHCILLMLPIQPERLERTMLEEALQRLQDQVDGLIKRNRTALQEEHKLLKRLQRRQREADRASDRVTFVRSLEESAGTQVLGGASDTTEDVGRLADLEQEAGRLFLTIIQRHIDASRRREERLRRFGKALQQWRVACAKGRLIDIAKRAENAVQCAGNLAQEVEDIRNSWNFDGRTYLEGDGWIQELQRAAQEKGIRTIRDRDYLIAPPVVIRSLPGQLALKIGKQPWPALRPTYVANEIAKIRKRGTGRSSQELLRHIYHAVKTIEGRKAGKSDFCLLRQVYDEFCLAPGWKKENPREDFAQSILALDKAGIREIESGIVCDIQGPSGNWKDKDVLIAYDEDGVAHRYYGILFRRE